MRRLLTPWRWPLSTAAALLLLLLLAAGAARFYPAGDLSRLMHTLPDIHPLVVMGEVTVVPDSEPEPEPETEDKPETPEPEPTLVNELWYNYIVTLADDETAGAPRLALPPLLSGTPDLSFFVMPDTSAASRLLWSASLQNALRGDWLREGRIGDYQRKAGDFQSRKKSIFNENWLESADLR